MTAPNLGVLELHAAGKVTAAGALSDGVNVASVVNNGAGDYTVTLSTQIDPTQRFVMLIPTATDGVLEHVIANDTDVVFDVGSDANNFPGVPANVAFSFLVFRTVKLG